ncbi:hypothetical protein PRZ48_010132 [Zasmidium cellare]|uniref:Ubiquitin-like domain-containing protein n=1 Tax=Zasmidium cellare TaxID=395010 RepID=A0ABR0EDN6_ZASCE|nr:hypothetical protein PRZ48_010132 [Zasmidium cellare]
MDKWYQHVGKHLQYLSYFSLPDRLRRVKSQTDDQGVNWVSSSYLNSPSETQDISAEGNGTETRHDGPKSKQAAVESEDTEHLSDNDSEVDAEGHLETIELDTGTADQREIQIRRRSRSASADTYGSRERSPRSVEVVSGSPKIYERSESVVDRRSKDDRYQRWDRERFERRGRRRSREDDVARKERTRSWPRAADSRVDRSMYRELNIEPSGQVGDEVQTKESPKSKEEKAKADKERQYNEFVEEYAWQRLERRELELRMESEIRDKREKRERERREMEKEIRTEMEEKQNKRERERMETEKRIKMEMEEKQYKRERERKEMEEKIKLEMKRKEAERKEEEILLEKKVEEKMWKKLTAFGFQDHQIRGILKGDKAKTPKPGYEEKGPAQREFEERERMGREGDFYGRSQDREPPREYYAPSQGYFNHFNPVPEHRAGWQAPPPQARPYTDYEDYAEPIRFEDAEYRRYRIPFKAARTWKGMQKIVREIYQGSEVRDMDEDIISGRWQVLDADDNGILPSSWEMSVKPGYVYKLAFTRPAQNDRSYDRDRYVDERARPRESEIIIEDERSRRRSRSPPIIIRREEKPEQEPAQQRNPFAPVEPQQPSEPYVDPRTGSPLPPPPPRPTIDIYNDFEPSRRRPSRAKGTKAVSWDPYLDDESGWYPSLESATRGGFRRPGRDSNSRSLQPQQTVSYAHPPPPPPSSGHARGGPVFPKVHRDHIWVDTLKYYDLPWEYDRNDPNYIIILRDLQREEANVLFEHTSRLKEDFVRTLPAVTAGPSSEWNAAAPASTSYPVYR